MKTQTQKLSLKKVSLVELSSETLNNVKGGGTTTDGNEQTTLVCGDCILVPTSIRNITK
ncbi:class I lanthipeptide [Lacinutrix sp. Hel_I_90]|uniref:class I lanthipeptide n=1 Tax=Lacinutrix sp. Hel_I_90 TaxID=1249999 RepID=UPI000A4D0D90|nr:class I lanthipeptide [Lacinutrix sp. Hel_I_90]